MGMLQPHLPFGGRLGREVRKLLDPHRCALDEEPLVGPGKGRHQVHVPRHRHDPLRVGAEEDVDRLVVGADGEQGTAVGVEEPPDGVEGALDDRFELVERGGQEGGGGVR